LIPQGYLLWARVPESTWLSTAHGGIRPGRDQPAVAQGGSSGWMIDHGR